MLKPSTICKFVRVIGALAAAACLWNTSAGAETTRIVALGASNTAGKGVSRDQAFPAQLEAMLRAKG